MMVAEVPLDAREPDPIADLIHAGAYRDALIECLRQHGGAVGRLCMAMLGDQAEAEETLQETLIAAQGSMPSYRGDGTVRAWLFGIARRLCARRLVLRGRREQQLRRLSAVPPDAEPDVTLQVRQRAATVRAALERLSPTDREALLLRYQGDLSFREIAHVCDIDEPTARKRASRALARLRELLSNQDLS